MMTGVPWEIDDTVPEGVPWEIDDVTPRQQATPAVRNNGLLPSANEDQGALARRRINALLQGVGGTANYLLDLGARTGNSLGIRDTNMPLPSARFSTFLEQLGLDQPKPAEQLVGGVLGGLGDPVSRAMAAGVTRQLPPQQNLDPLGRALPDTITPKLGPLEGMGMQNPPRFAPSRNPLETPVRTAAREQGMAAGYRFAPTDVPNTPMGNVGEYLSPSPQLKADLSQMNVRKLNENISNQLTLPDGTNVGREGFSRDALKTLSKTAWERGYKPIADMNLRTPLLPVDVQGIQRAASHPDIANRVQTILTNSGGTQNSGSMLTSIRDLRSTADKLYKTDPEAATALKDVAGILENRLGAHLAQVPGGPEAFAGYRQMRTFIAQVKTARRALGPGGNIDATKLAAAADKDVPLDGALRTGADMGENFPESMALGHQGESLLTQRTTGPVGDTLYRAVTLLGYPLRKWVKDPSYQMRMQGGRATNVGSPLKTQSLFGVANQVDDYYREKAQPDANLNLFQPD